MSWTDAERASCRRPIRAEEVPALEALGSEIRRLRRDEARLSRKELGSLVQLSEGHITRIELGLRRTRESTLRRIVAGLTLLRPELGAPEEVLENLLVLAGPVLASESLYCDRVERRRHRRWKRIRREAPERRRFARLNRLART